MEVVPLSVLILPCVCSPSVADDVQDVGTFVRDPLSSVALHIRGLKQVTLRIRHFDDELHASITASLPVGTNIGALSITDVSRVGLGSTRVAAARNA